ncbi:MAG: acyl-CoA dehydrogenase [Gammaproteobacteria bacterium]|nr:acyl-CoA dehydrogenase [Gammaproteobacteria bacterium]
MPVVFEALLLLAVAWGLAAWRAPALVWFATGALYLLSWSLWRDGNAPSLSLAWGAFLPIAALLSFPPLRRRFISRHLRAWFARVTPEMSTTEREALEAGTVWWDGDLFSGDPNWQRLLGFPAPVRTAQEQAFIDGPVEELCRRLDDWQITHELHDLPEPVWQFIKDNGFFGMIIPRQYGGLEFSALAHSDVVMKIASRSITAAVTVMVPNSLGPAKLLLHYGTEAQKDHYLPRLARGEDVPCFALTGPEAGSDAGAIPDTGVVCRGEFQGQTDVLGIRLNWDKRYITLGPVATVLGLAFKLHDPEHLLGDREELGITLALIPTDTPGITIGNRHFPLNMVFQNGPNQGCNVFIPMDWIIGGPERIGQGWTMLMECLADGRSISLPALSTGAGKLASRATGAYAAVRKQFKLPIGRFDGVREALARIAGNTYLMDAARELTCTAIDLGERPSVASAIVKYHLTERMRSLINDAMDVQGGSGICLGPRNLLGRVYQALPISITVEGANILTRSLIIFGQGALRCHPYVLKEMQAALDTDFKRGVRDFDRALFGHARLLMSNASRALLHGLTGARLVRAPTAGHAARWYRQFTRMSAVFGLFADVAMLVLGGDLKRRERLSARLGDGLSYLYLGSAVLKRFHDQGEPEADRALLDWSCQTCLYGMQQSLLALLENFPLKSVARLLRVWAFPTGLPYRAPNDRLADAVAETILQPSEARDRLTQGVFAPTGAHEPLGRLEDALVRTLAAEPILARIRTAMRDKRITAGDPELRVNAAVTAGIISADEAIVVQGAVVARRQVIEVDDFAPDQFNPQLDTQSNTGTPQWTSDPHRTVSAGRSM